MGTFNDLTGQRFGLLVVLKRAPNRGTGQVTTCWTCLCDCGVEVVKSAQKLAQVNTKQPQNCGCRGRADSGARSSNWNGIGAVPGRYWGRVTSNAKARGHAVAVTFQEVADLLELQDFKCALTGLPIGFWKQGPHSASLDRIDSNHGYVLGNVQWVHREINLMKNVLPLGRFLELCSLVEKNKRSVLGEAL